MVLVIQAGRLSRMSRGQKQLNEGHQTQVHLDKMALARWWPKALKTKLNLKGGLPDLISLRSDGSRGSQAGRLDRINGGLRRSRESQKTTLGAKGPT